MIADKKELTLFSYLINIALKEARREDVANRGEEKKS